MKPLYVKVFRSHARYIDEYHHSIMEGFFHFGKNAVKYCILRVCGRVL